MCRTAVGAGSSAGADKGPDRRQSNHERTDDQAGRRRPANTDSDGDSPVHAAADTPSKNAATSDTHCNFMRQGGGTSQGSSRVEEERHETSRGSHNRGTIRRKCRKQHRRRMLRPKKCLKEVIPEECNRQRASRAQNTRAFKQQVFDVAPPVFSVCVRGGPKIRTRGENMFPAQTARIASSGGSKVKQMISNQM